MKALLDNSDFNTTMAPWIASTYKMMDHYFSELLLNEKINVTKQQWIVLKVLNENKIGIIQNDLAFITHRNKASLTRLISVMEKKKLVFRKQSEKDARVNLVFTTEKGSEVFLKMKPIMMKAIKSLQKNISEEEIEQLITILSKIQENITHQIQ